MAALTGGPGWLHPSQAEAEKLITDARTAAAKKINEAKAAVQAECAAELAAAKSVRGGARVGWGPWWLGGWLHLAAGRAEGDSLLGTATKGR